MGLLLALILFAPAFWLSGWVARATSGQVQLITPRGTVWTGSAQLVLSGGAGSRDRTALPGRMAWQLRPAWRGVGLQLVADCCTPEPVRVQMIPGWGSMAVQIGDSRSQWPAELLAGLGTPWNTVQAEGSLQLLTQGVTLVWADGRMMLGGRTELVALGMSSRLSTLKPMGSYRVAVTGAGMDGGPTSLELSTIDGSLKLSGSGRWVGSRLRFEGVASAAPEHEAALANLLNIIGRRNGARSIITLG